MADSTPLVIDTDPGIDDALALLLAARWPKCRVRVITVTYGNTSLAAATRNARLVLRHAGAEVLTLPGCDRPLNRPLTTAEDTHGSGGLGDHALPEPQPVFPSGSALRDALRAAGEPVTLVTLGPLTNLAMALRLEPDLVRSRVTRHVAMAGNLDAPGNTGPHSEFNAWCDPEATDEVLRAGLGTQLVGLDVTRQLIIPAAAVKKLGAQADPEARWLGTLLDCYVRFHEQQEGLSGAVINDPLAIALAVEPSWGRCDSVPVRVDLSDGPLRGRTARGSLDAGDPPIGVFMHFDRAAVHGILLEHLFGRWLTLADFGA
jgi:inosine-uridine nucleoside N-ribohydrolase